MDDKTTSVDLPKDCLGTPIHLGDYVVLRSRAILVVTELQHTTRNDMTVCDGWRAIVRGVYPDGTYADQVATSPSELTVLGLSPEERLLADFILYACDCKELTEDMCKSFAEQVRIII